MSSAEYQRRIDELMRQRDEALRRLWAIEEGVAAGLPLEQAKALPGETREELRSAAQGQWHSTDLASQMRAAVGEPYQDADDAEPSAETPLRSGAASRDQEPSDPLLDSLKSKLGLSRRVGFQARKAR